MKKINVGGASSSNGSKAKNHASVEVGERLEGLIHQFIIVNPDYKKFKAQHETLSRDIGAESRLLYFHRFNGLTPESCTMLATVDGREVKLLIKDQYDQNLKDEDKLVEAVGQEIADRHFDWKTTYKIDYDEVPEEQQEALAEGIEKLRVELGLSDAAIVAKQFIAPKPGFHEARTRLLTEEQNQALDAILPVRSNPLL